MKLRIRFTKAGEMAYIGHLDMMRYFQKVIRRAGFDIAYSQGFNPHQILSFASPLGLGMTSEGEYFDGEFNSCKSEKEMLDEFNKQMCDGVTVTSIRRLPDEGKFNAMASLSAATYEIGFSEGLLGMFGDSDKEACEKWGEFISQGEIIIHKKTKSSEADVDIKPLIFESEFKGGALSLFVAAGSERTIKPTAIVSAFLAFAGIDDNGEEAFKRGDISIRRVDQFTSEGVKYISLGDVGEKL